MPDQTQHAKTSKTAVVLSAVFAIGAVVLIVLAILLMRQGIIMPPSRLGPLFGVIPTASSTKVIAVNDVVATKSQYSDTNTPYMALIQKNPDFANGDKLLRKGQYVPAIAAFQKALSTAADSVQRGQINFKIAYAEQLAGDYTDAIALYKQLIADPTYLSVGRAYAAMQLGEMVNATASSTVRAEVFSGEPYAGFVVDGDWALSLRKIYEYSEIFRPVALTELRIADWYAAALANSALGTAKLSQADTTSYANIVQQKLAAADASLKKTQDDPNLAAYTPVILTVRANVIRAMWRAGYYTADQVDASYQSALNANAVADTGAFDGSVRFQYARFLYTDGGAKNASKIHTLLAPIYTDSIYQDSPIVRIFKNEKTNVLGRKQDIVNLASVDPDLKKFLITLGWEDSDFVSH